MVSQGLGLPLDPVTPGFLPGMEKFLRGFEGWEPGIDYLVGQAVIPPNVVPFPFLVSDLHGGSLRGNNGHDAPVTGQLGRVKGLKGYPRALGGTLTTRKPKWS